MSDESSYESDDPPEQPDLKDDDFGDIEPDDAYSEGDDEVDWSAVDRVQSQVDSINAIADDDERLEAAKKWAQELSG